MSGQNISMVRERGFILYEFCIEFNVRKHVKEGFV